MNRLRVNMKMHFTTDAVLILVMRNREGQVFSRPYPRVHSDDENYYNSRKMMNQVPCDYSWDIDIDDQYEIDVDSSRVEFGYLDRRNYVYWTEGSPIRCDFLKDLINTTDQPVN